MLRGLRPVDVGSKIKEDVFTNIDLYKIRTQKDYFKQLNDDEQKQISDTIFTGLEIYEDVRKHLLGTREQRNKIQEFEQFLQETFFPDKEVSLVPKEGEDVLLIGLNDEERLIYDLGDGIQSIIQMLYPIFMRQGTNALFFIEEPELSLHPGMQRVFLETLLSERFSSMQFFITTHSNHFLDLTMDNDNISVYGFSKKDKDKFIIKLLEGPNKHVLKDIGVRNSSVFLANCSIWVEGVTDRKYLRKFLELYVKSKKQDSKYLEDMHYVFVEYGGSNIVHWSFDEKGNESGSINANKLNNSIFLIADSDIGKDGIQPDDKRNRHETLKQALGENFYITEGKEVENMLSPKAILHIVKHYEKSSESFKGDINRKTNQKSFNTQQKIKKPDYWNYNLGECIDVNLPNRERNTYKDGNTVLDKYRFCELAIESMDSFEDLSDEAKLLSEKIFNFIVDNNK
jgi:predicted ATP-dependent endonuclease of OLD family